MGFVNAINRAIGIISPTWALKRSIAANQYRRMSLLQKNFERSFEAISGSRTRYDFLSTSLSPDSHIKNDIGTLRNHVRQLEYNNGFVAGGISRIANNVVGPGIRFRSAVKADEGGIIPKINQTSAERFNSDVEKWFARWEVQADKRLLFGFYELQDLIERALLRDGEAIIIGRISRRRDRIVPYCLESLEADRLETPQSEASNPKIRNGIRYDEEGVPKSYFIYKRHPGDTLMTLRADSDFEEVPAYFKNGLPKVIHLFNPWRLEQSRGFAPVAPGLKDFQDLERYTEAEKIAALEAACLTATVETDAPNKWYDAADSSGEDDYQKIHEVAPGQTYYLRPGEKYSMHNPSRPNTAFGEYIDQLLRGPSNAFDVPPEVLTQNWKGMNYSNARTVLLQFYKSCQKRQSYLIRHLCVPVYKNVLSALVADGKVQAPSYNQRTEDWQRHGWTLPGWQWVDPVKEAQGKNIELNNNTETLTQICASKGRDVEEVLEEKARELKLIQHLEEKHGVKFPQQKEAYTPPADDEEEDERKPERIFKVI